MQLGKQLDNPIASAFFLELITGQQAKFTRIRRGNAQYKVREGFLEGSKVTLAASRCITLWTAGDDGAAASDRLQRTGA